MEKKKFVYWQDDGMWLGYLLAKHIIRLLLDEKAEK